MGLPGLLVVIPHSGIVVPSEIPLNSLSDQFPVLAQNVDWYTNWLYDFRDILDNRHLVFPYCSLILEANRHPEIIDDCVPLKDVFDRPVYRPGREPTPELRKTMSAKYLSSCHKSITDSINNGADFLFDGHSTISARGVQDNQIELLNYQDSPLDNGPKYFCPTVYVETYAQELRKRLPEVKVTVNQSEYYTVYGHVCSQHSVNAFERRGSRVPAFLQETNERLYKNPDRTPNIQALNRLRRAFAESLMETFRIVGRSARNEAGNDKT